MNTLKNSKTAKYTLAVGTLLIASSAVTAVLTKMPPANPEQFTSTTPTDSFVLDGSAEASTEINQLEWSRCLVGQTFTDGECTGNADEFTTWEAALAAPTPQQAADGWRVPNIKELMLITENTEAFPAINTEVFPFATQLKFAHDESYQHLPLAPSSPYIWSSTPIKVKTVKHDEDGNALPESEYAAATKKQRENTELTYALDLKLGQPQQVFRSGESIGERRNNQNSTPDPDNVQKARYVILVKDIPKA